MNSNTLPINAKAVLVGEDISLRLLKKQKEIISNPPVVELEANSYAVLFRYGVIVYFNVGEEQQKLFLESIAEFVKSTNSPQLSEEITIKLLPEGADTLDNNFIYIKEPSLARIQLIAIILARSVILEKHELEITKIIETFNPILQQLEQGKVSYSGINKLLKSFARGVLNKQMMVGKIEIMDNPDMLWANSELEPFYLNLRSYFEINDRFGNIEEKLNFISDTAESIFHLQHSQHSIRLEWYIVILIVFEIIISFWH